MNELLEKLSSYNLFNYLVPGVVFVFSVPQVTSFSFSEHDVFIMAFICYFSGMVLSRIGSLFVEPVLRNTGIIKFSSYEDYVIASKADPVIETLSEANNTYRTLCSVFLCLIFLIVCDRVGGAYPALAGYFGVSLVLFLFFLFALSYRKQTIYVRQRVARAVKRDLD